jgi:cellulose synthase/poly-beta-1,6-N-acetylglucosamine synthase-like glycosyltransferase
MHPRVGMTASYISLFLGLFYFCYALKYYISSFIALGVFNMDLEKAPADHPAHRILAQRTMEEEAPGDGPWVSVHLPFFNELNVARRILEACIDIDYLNFEIMVADDSRDATIEVLKERGWRQGNPVIKFIHRNINIPSISLSEKYIIKELIIKFGRINIIKIRKQCVI